MMSLEGFVCVCFRDLLMFGEREGEKKREEDIDV